MYVRVLRASSYSRLTLRVLFWKKLSPLDSLNTSPPPDPFTLFMSLIRTGPVAAHVTDACEQTAVQRPYSQLEGL